MIPIRRLLGTGARASASAASAATPRSSSTTLRWCHVPRLAPARGRRATMLLPATDDRSFAATMSTTTARTRGFRAFATDAGGGDGNDSDKEGGGAGIAGGAPRRSEDEATVAVTSVEGGQIADLLDEGVVDEEEDEMEQEDMFVEPHPCVGVDGAPPVTEWGGPTRGGRLAEPTRFGDWERKGRCTDF